MCCAACLLRLRRRRSVRNGLVPLCCCCHRHIMTGQHLPLPLQLGHVCSVMQPLQNADGSCVVTFGAQHACPIRPHAHDAIPNLALTSSPPAHVCVRAAANRLNHHALPLALQHDSPVLGDTLVARDHLPPEAAAERRID